MILNRTKQSLTTFIDREMKGLFGKSIFLAKEKKGLFMTQIFF